LEGKGTSGLDPSRTDASLTPSDSIGFSHCEVGKLAATIAREQRHRHFEAVRSLWRTGDAIRCLRDATGGGTWRSVLRLCALDAGVHPATLDEAARASQAFPVSERERLLARYDQAGALLTASHVIELARKPPRLRAKGIEILLRTRISTRELRAYLRADDRQLDRGPRDVIRVPTATPSRDG
jgi:hypothetical protein